MLVTVSVRKHFYLMFYRAVLVTAFVCVCVCTDITQLHMPIRKNNGRLTVIYDC